MRFVLPVLTVASAVAALVAFAPPAGAGRLLAGVLPVLSTTDALGKTMPCGCTVPKGGLSRLASVVDSTRQRYGDALVVDAGDFAPDFKVPAEKERLGFHLRMLDRIGYDAVGVGERELGFGVDELLARAAQVKVPLVSANLVKKDDGKTLFPASVVVTKGDLKVGVFAVMGRFLELPADAAERLEVKDPIAAARAEVAKLRKEADLVVGLAHVGAAEGMALAARIPGIDVLVLSHQPGLVYEGRRVGTGIAVASGDEIQNVGVTLVGFEGKTVTSVRSESRGLFAAVGERADILADVRRFETQQAERLRRAPADEAKTAGAR